MEYQRMATKLKLVLLNHIMHRPLRMISTILKNSKLYVKVRFSCHPNEFQTVRQSEAYLPKGILLEYDQATPITIKLEVSFGFSISHRGQGL